MKNKSIALEFATNMFGHLKPDVKSRLQQVIDNPNQETWNDAYFFIIAGGKTLWQAVLDIKPDFPRSKGLDSDWGEIPDSDTIIKAINEAVFKVSDRNEKCNVILN